MQKTSRTLDDSQREATGEDTDPGLEPLTGEPVTGEVRPPAIEAAWWVAAETHAQAGHAEAAESCAAIARGICMAALECEVEPGHDPEHGGGG